MHDSIDIFEQILESMKLGERISELVCQLHTEDQVKCVIAAAIDCFTHKNGGDSIAIVDDMLEMMREVRADEENN